MPQIDAKFFKPFVDGALHTLKVQCNVEPAHGKPFFKGTREQPQFDIAAVIGLTSNVFNGSITLCFTQVAFLGIMSNMLGETYTTITSELEDGAAELLNIIFGQAKAVLSQQGYTIEKAIPTVVRGTNLTTKHISSNPAMVLPFTSNVGEFHIEIGTEAKAL